MDLLALSVHLSTFLMVSYQEKNACLEMDKLIKNLINWLTYTHKGKYHQGKSAWP
jgi:hypothetical protein